MDPKSRIHRFVNVRAAPVCQNGFGSCFDFAPTDQPTDWGWLSRCGCGCFQTVINLKWGPLFGHHNNFTKDIFMLMNIKCEKLSDDEYHLPSNILFRSV